MEHKHVSLAIIVALRTHVTLYILYIYSLISYQAINLNTPTVELSYRKTIMPFWPYVAKAKLFCLFCSGYQGWDVNKNEP